MTVTALEIVTSALQRVGVYAPGEPLTDADAERGLIVLNDMVDVWAAAYVYIWQLVPLVVNLTVTVASYTLAGRPPRILYGPGAASVNIGAVQLADVVSALEFTTLFAATTALGVPAKVFYDPQVPNGVVNVSPPPSGSGTLTLSQYQRLPTFATLTTGYVLSPGSDTALRSNLCISLKAYWTAAKIDETIVETAQGSKKALGLQNLNSRAVPGRIKSAAQPRPPQP